jgi:hypothetical protein
MPNSACSRRQRPANLRSHPRDRRGSVDLSPEIYDPRKRTRGADHGDRCIQRRRADVLRLGQTHVGAGDRTVLVNGGPMKGRRLSRRRAGRGARSDVRTAVAPWLRETVLSRPVPKSSERGRGLARVGATDRAACVVRGRGASVPIILPLVTPEGIVVRVIAARAGIANRLRRRRIDKSLPGAGSGDSFVRRGARDIGADRSDGTSAPVICPLVMPEEIALDVVAPSDDCANRLLHLLLRRR